MNFKLRGQESDEDEASCSIQWQNSKQKLSSTKAYRCKGYSLEFGISTQMCAQGTSNRWFEEIRSTRNFEGILLAHHPTTTRFETYFPQSLRGTGIEDFIGMADRRGRLTSTNCLFPERTWRICQKKWVDLAGRTGSNASWTTKEINLDISFTCKFIDFFAPDAKSIYKQSR